ncbi:hypothetical protein BV898_08838 [Hypsibius exemplaris]|uniref:Receptor ligand binding region domain-containing protein n=1 Tax=Hypsibius exemplaris TaxID=2072580 RepID=A0A1W0WPI6_HYPEX|nr:hypothetical protein BV898_08838 [Hypsibius exemplaris]
MFGSSGKMEEKVGRALVVLLIVTGTALTAPTANYGSADVDIVTLTYFGMDSLVSANFLEPAYRTGLSHLRATYPHSNFTNRFISPPNTSSCGQLVDIHQDQLARWYYVERRPSAVPVIMANGFLPSNGTEIYVELLIRQNWTTVTAVKDTASPDLFRSIGDRLSRELDGSGITITARSLDVLRADLTELLTLIKNHCRVILFFGGGAPLRRLLSAATDHHMTNGEYVYLAVQAFEHPRFGSFTWNTSPMSSRENNTDTDKLRAAYQSVLILFLVQQDENDLAKVNELVPAWKNLSTVGTQLPIPYLTSTYAAFELLGIVINNSLGSNRSVQPSELLSGRSLAQQVINQTYHLKSGSLTLNGKAIRRITVALKQLDSHSDLMEVIEVGSENMDGTFTWTRRRNVSWFGQDHFPPNEPYCGYTGLAPKCLEDRNGRFSRTAGSTAAAVLVVLGTLLVSGWLLHKQHLQRSLWWNLAATDLSLSATP